MTIRYVVFDFDGVLCDSNEECYRVSLQAWREYCLDQGVEAVDVGDQRSQFCAHRGFVKGGAQYLVVWHQLSIGESIENQKHMNDLCEEFDHQMEVYKPYFYNVRKKLIAADYENWLHIHGLFDKAVGLFATLFAERRAQIATMKDKDSVLRILQSAGIPLTNDNIIDQFDVKDKLEALQLIAARENLRPEEILLIDDNVTHLAQPIAAGFNCRFAIWGYHTDEHMQMADDQRIAKIDYDQLENFELA